MGIKYINGRRLKQAILAGAERVIKTQDRLNKINVFPVPDGDTGTNMAATLAHISHGTMALERPDLQTLCNKIADSALNGARGNSGAIIAQFFQGLAEALDAKPRIDIQQFSDAINYATAKAKLAIADPVDGTIITVMHDWAEWIKNHWNKTDNFEVLLSKSLDVAKCSLKDTTGKLEALSKAGVVDAGAQGFVNFLQGITDCIRDGTREFNIEKLKDFNTAQHNTAEQITGEHEHHGANLNASSLYSGELDYQFCTECIIQGYDIDVDKVKTELSEWGNSQVVISTSEKVKIHIHTNDPTRLFATMSKFGEIVGIKADDMWAQYRHCIGWKNNKEIALITDSACVIPQDVMVKYNINVAPLQLLVGEKTYYDRININRDAFHKALITETQSITTSQPIPNDIQQSINKARQQAKSAIVITVTKNMSGTYRSFLNVAKQNADFPIDVIDSKNIATGQGLLVQMVAEAIHDNMPFSKLQQKIQEWRQDIICLCTPKTLKYMIRSGRLSKPKGLIASFLKLLPLILVDEDGKAKQLGFAFGVKMVRRKLIKELIKQAKSRTHLRLLVGHSAAQKDARAIARLLEKKLGIEEIPVLAAPPALVAHSGPGTMVVALYGKRK